jgi:hypothetical protein
MAAAFILLGLLGLFAPLVGSFLIFGVSVSGGTYLGEGIYSYAPDEPLLKLALTLLFMPVAVYGASLVYSLLPPKRREA